MSCKIFSALDNESFRPLEIFTLGRKFLDRTRWDAAVKLIRLGERFVYERFGADHAKIGKHAAAKDNAVRPDEAIIPNLYRLRCLPTLFDVNAVGHDLRLKPGDRTEFPDRDRIRAVYEMPMSDGGMLTDNQLRTAIRLLCKMPRRAERKASNPVAATDHRVGFEMKQIQSFAERQMINPGVLFHDETRRIDPRETDPRGWMNLIAELFLQKRTAHFPRQKTTQEHEKFSHSWAPMLR